MKIDEITKLPQQSAGFDINNFDIKSAKQISTAESIPLYHLKGGKKDTSLEAYSLKLDNKFVCTLIGKWGNLNGNAFFVSRTFTLPEYRNKGLITSLYVALYKKLKYKLVSDFEQSPESISVWKKISKVLPVKVLDFNTNQIYNMDDVPEDKIFGNKKEHENIRLMIEHIEVFWENVNIPDFSDSKIIKDNILYTHIDNNNKYI